MDTKIFNRICKNVNYASNGVNIIPHIISDAGIICDFYTITWFFGFMLNTCVFNRQKK